MKNPANITDVQTSTFKHLRDSGPKVARAWAIKELARGLWGYATRGWAKRGWDKWISWASRCRLEPMKRVTSMVRGNLRGILNAMKLDLTNATSESINARIQRVKDRASGFSNRERFRNAIYFHCGGLASTPMTYALPTQLPEAPRNTGSRATPLAARRSRKWMERRSRTRPPARGGIADRALRPRADHASRTRLA